jgi:thiamine-phosphate pyrophosphorylase
MRLVVITPEAMQPGEPAVARQMMQRGLQTLHLRKPGATRAQLAEYLSELGAPWATRIMLHSHHDLAFDFQVKVRVLLTRG